MGLGKSALCELAVGIGGPSASLVAMEQTAFLVRHFDDDRRCDWERAVRSADFAVGERVRIVSGPLAGLCGVLARQGSDGKWVLDASALARGIQVCIRGHQLSRE